MFVPGAIPSLYTGPRGFWVTDVSLHAGAAGGENPLFNQVNGNVVQPRTGVCGGEGRYRLNVSMRSTWRCLQRFNIYTLKFNGD